MNVNHVAIENAVDWFIYGWDAFRQDALNWVLVALVCILVLVGIGFLPVINLLMYFLIPLLGAGTYFSARKLAIGHGVSIEYLFSVFENAEKRQQLFVLGFTLLLIMFIVGLILAPFAEKPTFQQTLQELADASWGIERGMSAGGIIFTVLSIFSAIALFMAFVFAPALVLFKKMPAFEAIKWSFKGAWKNKGALILFIVVYSLLAFLAMIPFGLGMLVLLPITVNALYAAYQEIFPTH